MSAQMLNLDLQRIKTLAEKNIADGESPDVYIEVAESEEPEKVEEERIRQEKKKIKIRYSESMKKHT